MRTRNLCWKKWRRIIHSQTPSIPLSVCLSVCLFFFSPGVLCLAFSLGDVAEDVRKRIWDDASQLWYSSHAYWYVWGRKKMMRMRWKWMIEITSMRKGRTWMCRRMYACKWVSEWVSECVCVCVCVCVWRWGSEYEEEEERWQEHTSHSPSIVKVFPVPVCP